MSDFRTYHRAKRATAVPMQPLDRSGRLDPSSLGPVEDWAYRISDEDQEELLAAVADFRKRGVAMHEARRDSFPLNKLAGGAGRYPTRAHRRAAA